MKKHILVYIILFISLYWALTPIFQKGYFTMHDDTQVGRVITMGRSLLDGQFPVRWVKDLGYGFGYPIYNFYGPLPYYFGGFLYSLSFSALFSTKMMFLVGIILAALCMYIFISHIFGRSAGLVSAVLYTYAPYHAVQIYIRGAVGEYWILVFLPLLLLGIINIGEHHEKAGMTIGGLSLAGIILSHTIFGYLVTGFLLFCIICLLVFSLFTKKEIHLRKYVMLVLLGLGLSAFFWLPAFWEKSFTSVQGFIWDKTDYRDHFVCLTQLWNSPWGFGGSTAGCLDGFSFKLGKIQIITAIAGIICFFIQKRKNNSINFIMIVGIIITAFSLFMSLSYSKLLWQLIPNANYIQYPWRFITIIIFGLAILGGYVITTVKNRILRILLSLSLVTVTIIVNAKLFKPDSQYFRESAAFETPEELRYNVSRISDEYLPPAIKRPKNASFVNLSPIVTPASVRLEHFYESSVYLKYPMSSDIPSEIIVRKTDFPGWKYYVNSIPVYPKIVGGFAHIQVPAGFSTLEMYFTNTPIRIIGNIISLISVLVLLILYGKKAIC